MGDSVKRRRSIRWLPVSFNKSLPFAGKGWWKSIIELAQELEKIGWKISLFSVTLLLTADDDSAAAVERRL